MKKNNKKLKKMYKCITKKLIKNKENQQKIQKRKKIQKKSSIRCKQYYKYEKNIIMFKPSYVRISKLPLKALPISVLVVTYN